MKPRWKVWQSKLNYGQGRYWLAAPIGSENAYWFTTHAAAIEEAHEQAKETK